MHKTSRVSRRDFLKISTTGLFGLSGLLGLAGLLRFLAYRPEPEPPAEFNLGPASLYPPGSTTMKPEIPAVIYHRDGHILAYSLTCTHLGCTLAADPAQDAAGGFACACHGSRFDESGQVRQGPAGSPLKQLRVDLQPDGTLKLIAG